MFSTCNNNHGTHFLGTFFSSKRNKSPQIEDPHDKFENCVASIFNSDESWPVGSPMCAVELEEVTKFDQQRTLPILPTPRSR